MRGLKKLLRKKTTRMKATSLLVMFLMLTGPGMMSTSCTSNPGFLFLEDYQRDLLFGVGALAIALLSQGQVGPQGPAGPEGPAGPAGEPGATQPIPGVNGLHCWDLDGNGMGDPEEDRDGDGFFTAIDCQGADGSDGSNGRDGADGADGSDGVDGTDGVDGAAGADGSDGRNGRNGQDGANCWDITGDINQDGVTDTLDCVGADGLSCWDLDGDGVADPEEDIDEDGFFTALDCRGADGTDGVDGEDGEDGIDGKDGEDGADGADGQNCWDLNGNGLADPEEDVNGDEVVNVLDCQGADGEDGEDGIDGKDGEDGADGQNCWDLNGNGLADLEEDLNGDQVVNVLDCQGADGEDGIDGKDGEDGEDGLNCWDVNGNGLADPQEDLNGDQVVNVLDCRGADGEDGRDGQDGADGADGTDGLACWDLNGNGIADIEEDLNGDEVVDVYDCRGEPGAAGAFLFDQFIDDFFTVGNGSYNALPLDNGALPVVEITEPSLGACEPDGVDVTAYRVNIPQRYHPTNPVTMRLFIWRTGPRAHDCFVLRLDAFLARHGTGVDPYGETRYVQFDDPAQPDPTGTLLVVDLPLNNPSDDPADGLSFPNTLLPGDFLAFELNGLPQFQDGGCYTMLGAEFFESTVNDPVTVQHATVFKTLADVDCGTEFCTTDEDCNDGDECTIDTCDSATGQCEHETIPGCEKVDCNENGIPDDLELGQARSADGVVVCHVPPGEPENAHTIIVAPAAVQAHLDHGDTLGSCSSDCNVNGIPDECEIREDSDAPGGPFFCSDDCVGCPEVCDIDCNNNGIPDACDDQEDVCPTLDMVFVMDTSGSMRDEGDALCAQIESIIGDLDEAGVEVAATILAIHPNRSQDLFTCLSMSDTVHAVFGDDVPGDPDGCPGDLDGHWSSEKDENWGPATAIVAEDFDWTPGSIRMIVPISDEGPCLGSTGNGCNDPGSDRDALENAIEIANQNGVVVSPITASGSSHCVKTLAGDLAAATGGVSVESTDPHADLAGAIEAIVRAACVSFCETFR